MIDVINLKKSFGETEVLKDISVTINKGDIVVVLGRFRFWKKYFFTLFKLYGRPDRRKHYL